MTGIEINETLGLFEIAERQCQRIKGNYFQPGAIVRFNDSRTYGVIVNDPASIEVSPLFAMVRLENKKVVCSHLLKIQPQHIRVPKWTVKLRMAIRRKWYSYTKLKIKKCVLCAWQTSDCKTDACEKCLGPMIEWKFTDIKKPV